MEKILAAILFVFIASLPALAVDAPPPSEASIKELLSLTDRGKVVELMLKQMDAAMDASMREIAGDRTPTPEREKILADMRSKMVALFKEEMSPEVFEPMLVDVYRNNFTQQEVDGMLKFYKSDAGKAVLNKMPVVIQQTMQTMQGRWAAFASKMQEIMRDTTEQLKATDPK